uniref:FBD domain-containing protein n=1 Tax=Panagrellus redivivus TaxID=6233 RepID=A0A7E4UPG2_PANRE
MICDIPVFKNLQRFVLHAPISVNTWVEAFGEANCRSLTEFNLFNVLPSTIDFNSNTFTKLLENRNSKFTLYFRMANETAYNDAVKLLEALLGKQFTTLKLLDNSLSGLKKVIVAVGCQTRYVRL